jgi:ubiquinol-cytochrome c reductase cytochrome b subunit
LYVLPWGQTSAQYGFCSKLLFFGPLTEEMHSVIVGNLLGGGSACFNRGTTTIQIVQSSRNVEYLYFLHKIYSINGLCRPKKPKLYRNGGVQKGNKIFLCLRLFTKNVSILNQFHEAFYYKKADETFIKRIPEKIKDLLTPRALAIWIMEDGSFQKPGLRISTNSFIYEDVILLQNALKDKFNLDINIHFQINKKGLKQYRLYIQKKSMDTLILLVKPYMISSMYYKLGLKN